MSEGDKLDPRLHFVVATAIIVKDGGSAGSPEPKFLIAKRAGHEKAFPNKWTVPGGKLVLHEYKHLPQAGFRGSEISGTKNGDTVATGNSTTPFPQWYNVVDWVLRKEVRDEVGLEIEKPSYLCDLVFIRPDGYPVVTLSYWALYKSGEVALCKDLTDYAWVTVEEAKKYDLIEGIGDELTKVAKLI